MFGQFEIGVVAVMVVLLFGTRKLPELGSGLGKAISNFKRSYREASEIDVTPSEKGSSVDDAKQGDSTGSGS